MRGSVADLTVRFESEIVTSVKDRDGRVVEGSDTAVRRVIDIWTFSRDTRSSDPNWLLVDTDTGD
jgi:predicted lipid-binding transport protein (Tim44 family)